MLLVLDDIYKNQTPKKSFVKDFFKNQTIRLSKPLSYRGLTLVGISSSKNDGQRYITLSEGLKLNQIQINEVSESGNVPQLSIQNKSNLPCFVMDGEELIGAKQNRITNSSFLIAPHSSSIIPVSCVEQNRWNYNSRNFSASENIIFNKGRKEKFQDIHQGHSYQADQSRVWSNIQDKMSNLDAMNDTSSMNKIYKSKKSELEEYVSKFQAQENDIGVIYAIGDKIEGIDIFHGSYLFKQYLPKIIKSCVLEIIEQGIKSSQIPVLRFKKFFDDICHLPVTANRDYFGLGSEYRSKNTGNQKANIISHNELPVHLLGVTVH